MRTLYHISYLCISRRYFAVMSHEHRTTWLFFFSLSLCKQPTIKCEQISRYSISWRFAICIWIGGGERERACAERGESKANDWLKLICELNVAHSRSISKAKKTQFSCKWESSARFHVIVCVTKRENHNLNHQSNRPVAFHFSTHTSFDTEKLTTSHELLTISISNRS